MKTVAIPPSEWAGLSPAWNDLLERASEASVFLCPEWITAWWRAYGGEHDPKLLTVFDEQGQLLGLAPLYERPVRLGGVMHVPVIGVMGDLDVGSEYQGLLVLSGREKELLAHLTEVLEGRWALCDFHGLGEDGILVQLIPEVLGARAPQRVHRARHPCPRILLPDNYESYLLSLAPKFRSTLRYRTNKLLRNFSVRLISTSREEEVDGHLDRFIFLHQERWRMSGDVGAFSDPRMRAFYRDVAAAFLRRGWLRFYHLEVDGVIEACQFGFAYGGVLYSLQEAFDASFRPPGIGGLGVILRGMAIRESIAEGLRVYDFLEGEQEFKTRWGATTRYVQRVRIGAPGLVGLLAFAATAGSEIAKDWARAHVPRSLLEARRQWRARYGASRVEEALRS